MGRSEELTKLVIESDIREIYQLEFFTLPYNGDEEVFIHHNSP